MHVPLHTLEHLNISPMEPVLLKSCHESSPASIILQAIPIIDENGGNIVKKQKETSSTSMTVVKLHPFMEEFLVCAAEKFDKMKSMSLDESNNAVLLQYAHRNDDGDGRFNEARIVTRPYVIEKVDPELICESRTETGPSAKEGFRFKISLQLMCSTNEEYDKILSNSNSDGIDDYYSYLLSQVKEGLQCRTIQKGSFIAISLPCIQGLTWKKQRNNEIAIFCTANVEPLVNHDVKDNAFYELGQSDEFEVSIVSLAPTEEGSSSCGDGMNEKEGEIVIEKCPGYDSLVEEIVEIAKINVQKGAPSGVMISGCRGVGKTRLVSIINILLFLSVVEELHCFFKLYCLFSHPCIGF